MSAYVLDNAGEMGAYGAHGRPSSSDMHTALLKAQTALKASRAYLHSWNANARNASAVPPRAIPAPTCLISILASGGIPIVVDGQMIGAVGVSGVDGRPG